MLRKSLTHALPLISESKPRHTEVQLQGGTVLHLHIIAKRRAILTFCASERYSCVCAKNRPRYRRILCVQDVRWQSLVTLLSPLQRSPRTDLSSP